MNHIFCLETCALSVMNGWGWGDSVMMTKGHACENLIVGSVVVMNTKIVLVDNGCMGVLYKALV